MGDSGGEWEGGGATVKDARSGVVVFPKHLKIGGG